ncbi:MAG TPA: hypothetical protein PKD12_06410 [Nitrospira sp.]|nr:hypothetical protein [Nitrospira sp.]
MRQGSYLREIEARITLGSIFTAFIKNDYIQKIGSPMVWTASLRSLAIAALVFSAFITFRYIQQPIVEPHAFRQAQTALTAYWILKEGWMLAYQTPVAGFPWSIPFEFPIYQMIVAAVSAVTSLDLVAVGRVVSFAFLVGCAWPVFAISRRLTLPDSVPWVFCAVMWTSPLSVFWGRTFMIETTAVFFTLACIPYAMDLIRRDGGWQSPALFVGFASLGILQKATTCGPVLLFLLLAAVAITVREKGVGCQALQQLALPIATMSIPLAIGAVWAHYTDTVKMENPLGAGLTSHALVQWNFGTLGQRLDFNTWRLVVWERLMGRNVGGIINSMVLILPWIVGGRHRRFAWLSFAAVALFLLPIGIFTNLHFIHDYYQVACVAFLSAAVSIVIGGWLVNISGKTLLVPAVTMMVMLANITEFNAIYGTGMARSLHESDPRSVKAHAIASYLREHTPADSGLVIFGQDWSSEVAFLSQRRTMTSPVWFLEYRNTWEHPGAYLGSLSLGAIVVCPSSGGFPNEADVDARVTRESGWRVERVSDCQILLPSNGRE